MALTPGQTLQGRYAIQTLLGQGGMGAVYLARDLRLGCMVAVKENTGGDPRQFQQEAVILANLHHPNLPRVSDHFVEPNGAQYLVMDFIEGEDLETRLQRGGALPEAQALIWFNQILDAVGYLHSRGIIHRDIKPENIKITPTGQAVLVDFGIAKVYQAGRPTLSGAKAGTPGFAAPEQYGGGTDQRSDIYSLGATLYAYLTACAPPDALGLASGSAMLVSPRTLNPTISGHVEQAIVQAMAVAPQKRFQSAAEMKQALTTAPIRSTQRAQQPTLGNVPPYRPVSPRPAYIASRGSSNSKGSTGMILAVAIGLFALFFCALFIFFGGRFILAALAPTTTPTRVVVLPLATNTSVPTVVRLPTQGLPPPSPVPTLVRLPTQALPTALKSQSTGIISSVTMAQGTKGDTKDPVNPTDIFQPNSVFHAVVAIVNAPANTKFTAAWYVVDVGNAAAPGSLVDSTDLTTDGTRNIDFTLTPNSKWPLGKYRVEIAVNGALDRVVNFNVQ